MLQVRNEILHLHIRKEFTAMTMLSRFADGLIGRFENWRARERAFRELSALDDRALADIGLARSDIPYVLEQKPIETGAGFLAPEAANSNVRHAA
jgi:uncharacterized protein YjiS (DUF1127 family)